jgi:hypothetical protein
LICFVSYFVLCRILYCIVLYCIVLSCLVLCCIVSYFVAFYLFSFNCPFSATLILLQPTSFEIMIVIVYYFTMKTILIRIFFLNSILGSDKLGIIFSEKSDGNSEK